MTSVELLGQEKQHDFDSILTEADEGNTFRGFHRHRATPDLSDELRVESPSITLIEKHAFVPLTTSGTQSQQSINEFRRKASSTIIKSHDQKEVSRPRGSLQRQVNSTHRASLPDSPDPLAELDRAFQSWDQEINQTMLQQQSNPQGDFGVDTNGDHREISVQTGRSQNHAFAQVNISATKSDEETSNLQSVSHNHGDFFYSAPRGTVKSPPLLTSQPPSDLKQVSTSKQVSVTNITVENEFDLMTVVNAAMQDQQSQTRTHNRQTDFSTSTETPQAAGVTTTSLDRNLDVSVANSTKSQRKVVLVNSMENVNHTIHNVSTQTIPVRRSPSSSSIRRERNVSTEHQQLQQHCQNCNCQGNQMTTEMLKLFKEMLDSTRQNYNVEPASKAPASTPIDVEPLVEPKKEEPLANEKDDKENEPEMEEQSLNIAFDDLTDKVLIDSNLSAATSSDIWKLSVLSSTNSNFINGRTALQEDNSDLMDFRETLSTNNRSLLVTNNSITMRSQLSKTLSSRQNTYSSETTSSSNNYMMFFAKSKSGRIAAVTSGQEALILSVREAVSKLFQLTYHRCKLYMLGVELSDHMTVTESGLYSFCTVDVVIH